jgi:hypothetical protein
MSKETGTDCPAFLLLLFINMSSSIAGSRQVVGDVVLCNHRRNSKLRTSTTIFNFTPFFVTHDFTTPQQKSKEHLDTSPSKRDKMQVEYDTG